MHQLLRTGSLFMLHLPGAVSGEHDFEPSPVDHASLANLVKQSPFQRLVSVRDTYQLHGIAKIGERTIATLHHKKTGDRVIVGDDQNNGLGMKLLTVNGSNPKNLVVKISFFGEEAEFTYQETQLAHQPPPRIKHTIRRDREGRPATTEELVKKYYTLTGDQRKAYHRWKDELLKAQPKLRYSEKRFPIAHKALDAFKSGKEPPRVK